MILFIFILIQYTYSFNTNFIKTTTHYQNNKIISVTPGGYKGFYTLGVCDYIKQNYDLSNYLFSGASAGAWNALFLSFKGNNYDFINDVLNIPLSDKNNIQNLQYSLKYISPISQPTSTSIEDKFFAVDSIFDINFLKLSILFEHNIIDISTELDIFFSSIKY